MLDLWVKFVNNRFFELKDENKVNFACWINKYSSKYSTFYHFDEKYVKYNGPWPCDSIRIFSFYFDKVLHFKKKIVLRHALNFYIFFINGNVSFTFKPNAPDYSHSIFFAKKMKEMAVAAAYLNTWRKRCQLCKNRIFQLTAGSLQAWQQTTNKNLLI